MTKALVIAHQGVRPRVNVYRGGTVRRYWPTPASMARAWRYYICPRVSGTFAREIPMSKVKQQLQAA